MIEPVRIGDATLYLGSAEDAMHDVPRVDAVVTDPPYGIGIAKRGTLGSDNHAPVRDYGKSDWDDAPADQDLISLLRIQSDHQIIFGGNYFILPPSSCWLVWDKQNTGDYADCELAWTNLKKAVRRIYWRWNGMIRQGNEERFHPTQKPLGVMKWCIEQLPADCQSILDPYMGSGTTGVAAVALGKTFIGIEREPKYFDIACKRIEAAYAQPDMFVQPPARAIQEPLL
jgi:DNA modification methylase